MGSRDLGLQDLSDASVRRVGRSSRGVEVATHHSQPVMKVSSGYGRHSRSLLQCREVRHEVKPGTRPAAPGWPRPEPSRHRRHPGGAVNGRAGLLAPGFVQTSGIHTVENPVGRAGRSLAPACEQLRRLQCGDARTKLGDVLKIHPVYVVVERRSRVVVPAQFGLILV
jgi:hypothetical protein